MKWFDSVIYVNISLEQKLIVHVRIIVSFPSYVQCQCELPESYEAYRKQQHRWHSGPMQLFRLCLPDIIRSKVYNSRASILSVIVEFLNSIGSNW